VTFVRRLVRWAAAHLQAVGLSFLLVVFAAAVFWFFASFVPDRRDAATEGWRRELSLRADPRRDLLDRRILDVKEDLTFFAAFPSVRGLLTPGLSEETAGAQAAHLQGILSDFRQHVHQRSVSILDPSGRVRASNGGPAPGAAALALAADAIRSGVPGVALAREPDGVTGLASAVPVTGDAVGAGRLPILGAVLSTGDASTSLFDLLGQPVAASSSESLLVGEDGTDVLFLSPLRFRPDPPLSFRLPLASAGLATRAALSEKDHFRVFSDYRGARVFAAVRRLESTPWGLVVKVDEDEALAAFRKDMLQKGVTWGVLFLALSAAAFGFWRSLAISNEVTLARSEARFGALIEQATDAVFIVGSDGKIRDANRAAEENYGWDHEALVGRHVAGLRPEDQRHIARANLEAAGREGRLVFEGEHVRADGSRFPVEVSTRLVNIPGDSVHLSIVRDITVRKRAEANVTRLNAELEEALAWQRQIFEGSRDAVFVSDEQARFVAVNHAATELTGYSHEELLAMGIPDLHDEPDLAAYRAFHRRILDGERILSEAPIRKKDGGKVAVEFNNSLVAIGGRRFMHTAGRDLTERRQLEAQLVQAQKMEAIGRLAGGVAHDFNNLLTVIQGYGELVRDSLSGDPRHESMEELLKAAGRATSLTRQLLAFSRKQVLEPKVVHLGEIVRETGRMLERLIGEDIAVSLGAHDDLATVKADPGQIEQVVLNLAVNARDAMPSGGQLTVSVGSLTMATPLDGFPDQLPAGRWVLMTVEDTGSGMDAETLSHAFEPFFTTKERGKGTGLGLSTVYGIVRQSGGRVQVSSVPGRGTSFQIYLPRSDEKTTSGPRPSAGSSLGTETVLVVEDEAAVRNLVKAVLERKGYVVLVAEDGAAALDLVDTHTGVIHVLLTDVVMPGMNGRDLAVRVRERRPAIKVVFMSGYTADVPTELVTEGGAAFLSKPFNERALTMKLREALDAPPA